jgi:hypothetical protein
MHQQQQQLQVQAQRQAQLGMPNQPGMNGQMARAGISQQQQPQQQNQSPFHHLQHQMQASPLPSQQQQQLQHQQQQQRQQQIGMGMGMGMVNNSLPQNMQQPQQLQMNIPQQQQAQGQVQLVQPPLQPQQQPQQMALNRAPGGQPAFTPPEQAVIAEMTQRLMNNASEEEKSNIRQTLRDKVDHAMLLRYQSQGIDPSIIYFRNQAMSRVRAQKQAQLANQQAQGLQGNVNIPSATPMQPQRSGNANVMGGQGQGHGQQPQMVANQDFGNFLGVENFIGKQPLAQQDTSQMNVPASLPQGNSTPQSLQGLPGQQPGGNSQRAMSTNPNIRAQQQAFNAQQAQQERLNQAARANAQNEARKLGLQGQPGGMGPMPPQQSPVMSTLNTPLRTSQPTSADPQQINQPSTTQFGQAIDPRFVQMSQQRTSQGPGVNSIGINGLAFPANMTQEQKQKLSTLPRDKLSEVIGKWNAANQAQAGKQQAQMPVQGARLNQPIAQPAPFNPQAAQYIAGIQSGQPQQMMANMTPQQQSMLRQQLATRNQQQGRLPNMPLGLPTDSRAVTQIDQLDFPRQMLETNPILRQVPPETKRWAEIKQWASQNPAAIQANLLELIKGYQALHYQNILRARNHSLQQRQQAGALPNAQAGSQAPAASAVPPGMAPIAPMGQNNPINMSISQEDIQRARAHPSGRWASVSDEEIKQMIKTQMHNRQRMELQQRQVQLTQINQMSQSQSQQPASQGSLQRPSVAQTPQMQQSLSQGIKQGNRPQPGPGVQPGQQAQQPPSTADTLGAAPPTGRAGRTAQANRGAPQASSPSQNQKNSLKRSNSDDVVEVPNPNAQQVPQSTSQQPQNQRKPPHRVLTAQQLANLTPEQRQKYEQSIAAQQTVQAKVAQANAAQANSAQASAAQVNPAQANSALRAGQANIQLCNKALEEEALKSEPFVPIPMTPEMRRNTSSKLLNTGNKLRKVKQALPKWFAVTHDQNRLRSFCRNVSPSTYSI